MLWYDVRVILNRKPYTHDTMKTNDQIAFYCFNRTCKSSIYFSSTIRVVDLPLTMETLTHEHRCNHCNARMVSMMDIEVKRALHKKADPIRAALRLANRV
jgi:hypothetical protein